MKEFKGTPGPWKFAGLSESGNSHYRVIGTKLGSKYKIARCPFHKFNNEILGEKEINESEANAKLIAAAPELLESLQELLEDIPASSSGYSIRLKAVNAVNKALGL